MSNIEVPVLSDYPVDNPYVSNAVSETAALILAAKTDNLIAVVCDVDGTDTQAVILCARWADESGQHGGLVPLARLFDDNWSTWASMHPPKCATTGVYEH